MKRFSIILLIVFYSLMAWGQPAKQSITWLRVQDVINTRHFVWQGDTIDFSTISGNVDDVDLVDGYLKFYSGTTIIDSVFFEYYQDVDTLRIEGDSLKLKLTDSDAVFLNISSLTSKMDTVVTGESLTGQGTIDSPLEVDSTIIANNMKIAYKINLPSAGSVGDRVSGAVEGTDYPTGWVLAAGTNGADLSIIHNLDRLTAYVSVWSIDGTEYTQLLGNAAYSGVKATRNSILLEGFATVMTDVSIHIVLVQ